MGKNPKKKGHSSGGAGGGQGRKLGGGGGPGPDPCLTSPPGPGPASPPSPRPGPGLGPPTRPGPGGGDPGLAPHTRPGPAGLGPPTRPGPAPRPVSGLGPPTRPGPAPRPVSRPGSAGGDRRGGGGSGVEVGLAPAPNTKAAAPALANMESGYGSSSREILWRSAISTDGYALLKGALSAAVNSMVVRELGQVYCNLVDILLHQEPMKSIMEDAQHKLLEAIGQKEDAIREFLEGNGAQFVGFDEVFPFCEWICEMLGTALRSTTTEEEEQVVSESVIPTLQKICAATMDFCASRGQPVILSKKSQAVPELDCVKKGEEGPAAVARGEASVLDSGKKEVEGPAAAATGMVSLSDSGNKEVEGSAAVARGKVSLLNSGKKEVEGPAVVTRGGVSWLDSGKKEVEGRGEVSKVQTFVVTEEMARRKWCDTTRPMEEDEDAAYEEEAFARYRQGWERFYGDSNTFEELTLFSPMLFTHCTPGFIPVDAIHAKTVQVCSIKVAAMEHFNWPLEVYGVVAARDVVDKRRNPLFLRPRDDCQVVYEKDPFLHLTGPVRAIVSEEPVDIEIQLLVKGTTAAEDRALISYPFLYEGDNGGARVRTNTIEKYSCTLELCTQQIIRSVQATIFGLHIVDVNSMPEYGFKVFCSSLTQSSNEPPEIVLFDSKVGRKCGMKNGFLNLSRQVISVEMRGKLKLTVQAYSESGDVAAESHVLVVPKRCNTTHHELHVGGLKVAFTVAWSLLVDDEDSILINGMVDPFALLPPMHPSIAGLFE